MKRHYTSHGTYLAAITAMVVLSSAPISVQAGPGTNNNIAQSPLFIGTNAKPNIIVSIDDSASMDLEMSFDTKGGGLVYNMLSNGSYTNNTARSNTGSFDGSDYYNYTSGQGKNGVLNYDQGTNISTGDFANYLYMFPLDNASGNEDARLFYPSISFFSRRSGGTAIPPFIQYGFARSSDFNGMYYDPKVEYRHWRDLSTDLAGTRNFGNANPTAVKSDPAITGTRTVNLTQNIRTTAGINWSFRVHENMVVPAGTIFNDGLGWVTATADDTMNSNFDGGGAYAGISARFTPTNRPFPFPPFPPAQDPANPYKTSANTTPSLAQGGFADLYLDYYPSEYYRKITAATAAYSTGTTSGTCDNPLPAHYDQFEAAPSNLTDSSTGTDPVFGVTYKVDALAPDGSCLQRVIIRSGLSFTAPAGRTDCGATCTYTEEIQNFANWFQYYRKRHLALRAAAGESFSAFSNPSNPGNFFTALVPINSTHNNASPGNMTMLDFTAQPDRDTFFNSFYNTIGNFGRHGTPNRDSLTYIGQQLSRSGTGAPIQYACQKNFALMFTDGYSNEDSSRVNEADLDSGAGAPYADIYPNTLADRAYKYYNTNLNSSFPTGMVPVNPQCNLATPPQGMDCNKNLHLQTFGLTLNINGTIYNPPAGAASACNSPTFSGNVISVQDAYACDPIWPDVNQAKDNTQVDDLYHAAVNGYGDMFNATNAKDLSTQLQAALNAIIASAGNSASAIAVNTSQINNGSVVYVAQYDTSNWDGKITSLNVIPNPSTSGAQLVIDTANPNWTSSVPKDVGREVITYGANNKGVAFTRSNYNASLLSPEMTADLAWNVPTKKFKLSSKTCGSATCTALDRIDHVRGGGFEDNTIAFRERKNTPLGDIINSSLVFVAAPSSDWPNTAPFPTGTNDYRTFRDNNLTREPLVYVGANDAMLHAFKAADGTEVFAYVPSLVSPDLTDPNAETEGLHVLTDPTYQHKYYVDQTPAVQDMFIPYRDTNGAYVSTRAWRTVLVSGLGAGGKGVFALDITDPTLLNEAKAQSVAMWEFGPRNVFIGSGSSAVSDQDDLGRSFSEVTLVMTNIEDASTKNNRWAAIFGNGYDSTNCNAALYVAFMDSLDDTDRIWNGEEVTNNSTVYASVDFVKFNTGENKTNVTTLPAPNTAPRCNGMSTPTAADLDGNGTVDRVYAGDMHGNMWVFDLCNRGSSPSCDKAGNWSIANTPASYTRATPLFTATDRNGYNQSISSRPRLTFHPSQATNTTTAPNLLVAFGTGKYLETTDATETNFGTATTPIYANNSFYVVWDEDTGSLKRSNLVQKILSYNSARNFRRTSTNAVTYIDTATGLPKDHGWYVDLDLPNSTYAEERVIYRAVITQDIVFFTTAIPDQTVCSNGGDGWLMFMMVDNGSPTPTPVVDVNGDGVIDSGDLGNFGGPSDETISGVRLGNGIPSQVDISGGKLISKPLGGNSIELKDTTLGFKRFEERLNWRELRQQ